MINSFFTHFLKFSYSQILKLSLSNTFAFTFSSLFKGTKVLKKLVKIEMPHEIFQQERAIFTVAVENWNFMLSQKIIKSSRLMKISPLPVFQFILSRTQTSQINRESGAPKKGLPRALRKAPNLKSFQPRGFRKTAQNSVEKSGVKNDNIKPSHLPTRILRSLPARAL